MMLEMIITLIISTCLGLIAILGSMYLSSIFLGRMWTSLTPVLICIIGVMMLSLTYNVVLLKENKIRIEYRGSPDHGYDWDWYEEEDERKIEV
jgi:hypothetical protein